MRINKVFLLSAVYILLFGACNSSSVKDNQTNSADSKESPTGNTSQTFELDTSTLHSGETFYQCSMHPEVLSDKPGICPRCEMDLSEMKKQ